VPERGKMSWIKMSDRKPAEDSSFLYFDGENMFMGFRHKSFDWRTNTHPLEINSVGYYCNKKDCSWHYDDCGCHIVESPDHYWMPLPNKPTPS
jgi:hypothetical protein